VSKDKLVIFIKNVVFSTLSENSYFYQVASELG